MPPLACSDDRYVRTSAMGEGFSQTKDWYAYKRLSNRSSPAFLY